MTTNPAMKNIRAMETHALTLLNILSAVIYSPALRPFFTTWQSDITVRPTDKDQKYCVEKYRKC